MSKVLKAELRDAEIPTIETAKGKTYAGIGLVFLGLTGILFAAITGMVAVFPLALFVPIAVVAFGVLGIVMGATDAYSNHHHR